MRIICWKGVNFGVIALGISKKIPKIIIIGTWIGLTSLNGKNSNSSNLKTTQPIMTNLLWERYFVMFDLWHESIVRLSSVCDDVAPYAQTWTFPQYFCTIGQFVLKFWQKIEWVLHCRWSCKLNGRGDEKLTLVDQYLALFRKRHKIRP